MTALAAAGNFAPGPGPASRSAGLRAPDTSRLVTLCASCSFLRKTALTLTGLQWWRTRCGAALWRHRLLAEVGASSCHGQQSRPGLFAAADVYCLGSEGARAAAVVAADAAFTPVLANTQP
jgi:hypothetical protein